MNKREIEQADRVLEKAAMIAKTSSDQNTQYAYLRMLEKVLYKTGRYQQAKHTAEKLLTLSFKLKDKFRIAESYHAIGSNQVKLRQLNLATENIIRALKHSQGLSNFKEQRKYNYLLSVIFFQLRDPAKTLHYAAEADKLAKLDTTGVSVTATLLEEAINQLINRNQDLSVEKSKQALQIGLSRKDTATVALAYLYLRHAYYKKGDNHTALNFLQKIQPLLKARGVNQNMKMYVDGAFAESYYALGRYDLAKAYYERSIKQMALKMDITDVKEMYQLGSEIYEKLGEPAVALSYLKKYKMFNDSVSKISTEKAIHESEIKYQTTLKEKAISEQKLQLLNKDFELHKKNRYLFGAAVVVILLCFTAIIVHLVHRNKTQAIELSLLNAQIHPHFLFNTLNNLYSLTIAKADEAPRVVLGISAILRYILYECNTMKVDLGKELEVIENYVELEKIRHHNRLEINLNVEGDVTGRKIAPLLILPLVENAFKHGVSRLTEDAWINIDAKVRGDRFIFKIANNAPQTEPDKLSGLKYGNIGLTNIKKRLTILYQKRHRFKITSEDDIFIVLLEVW